MHPRTVVLLLIGFLGGLGLAACGTNNACSAATCGGCCDQTGKCQSGATADACGLNGASCGRCGMGTTCMAGECRAGTGGGGGGGTGGGTTGGGSGGGSGGGTGGGTTGGGSGGGATGGGGGCRVINTLAAGQSNLAIAEYRTFTNGVGHYNIASWGYPTGGNPDGFRLEVVYPNDNFPTLPVTGNFTQATRYNTCTVCGIYYEDCPTPANCTREYLAQTGSITVTRADRGPAGRLQGSGTSVRFNEWDVASDSPSGTGCVIINSIGPIDVGWNADGGAIPP